jgi:hypothetical protein
MKENASHNGIRNGKNTKTKLSKTVANTNTQTNFTTLFLKNGLPLHKTDNHRTKNTEQNI